MKSSFSAACAFSLLVAGYAGAETPAEVPAAAPVAAAPVQSEPAPTTAADPTATPAPAPEAEPTPAPEAAPTPAPEAAPAPLSPRPAENAAAPVEPERPLAGFDKGFFVQSADGKFKWVMGARIQARLTVASQEDATSHAVTDSANFRLPRVRLHGKGHVFSENVTYRWQIEFGQGYVALRDAYLNFKLHPSFQIRAGQDTKPFSREQMTSGFRQQLVDRSLTDTKMGNVGGGDGGTGRDVGVLIHNGYDKAVGFEYDLGVYNGTGINPWLGGGATVDTTANTTNTPVVQDPSKALTTIIPTRFSPQVVARLGFNNGIKGYTFSDLEGGEFRYGIAVSGMSDFDLDGDGNSRLRGEADAIVKWQGFSAVGTVFLGSAQAAADWMTRRLDLVSTMLEGGYVIGGLVEPALRWTWLEQTAADGSKFTENDYTLGLNLFLQGHDLKWATDFTIATKDATSAAPQTAYDYIFRSQAQVQF